MWVRRTGINQLERTSLSSRVTHACVVQCGECRVSQAPHVPTPDWIHANWRRLCRRRYQRKQALRAPLGTPMALWRNYMVLNRKCRLGGPVGPNNRQAATQHSQIKVLGKCTGAWAKRHEVDRYRTTVGRGSSPPFKTPPAGRLGRPQDVTWRAMGLRTAHFLSASTQVRLPNRQTSGGITALVDALIVRVKVRDWPAAVKRRPLV